MQAHTSGAGEGGGKECLDTLADKLRRIDVEFARRSEEMLKWRLDAKEQARAEHSYISYSVGTNQFHVRHGRNACTAAAVAAALYVLNYTAPNFIEERDSDVETQAATMCGQPWLTIVKSGARLWKEYMRQGHSIDFHVEVSELLASGGVHCTVANSVMEVVEELAGHTDSTVVAAMDPDSFARTLSECTQRMPPRTALVVTATSVDVYNDGHGVSTDNNNGNVYTQLVEEDVREDTASTVVVIHLVGDVWWVYDSHGGVDTKDAALLCSCLSPDAVELVLKQQLPTGLYSATLYQRRRGGGSKT